jgi:hypothetical protein
MVKRPLIDGTRIGSNGLKVGVFLTTLLNRGETLSLRKPRGSMMPWINGRVYLPRNYKLYWSHVWDPLRSRKEAAFMWSIWHKAIIVNE